MGKCICFSRVSTIIQDLDQQNNELYAEAERCGYDRNDIILIEHKESAIKLSEIDRLGVQELKDTINKEDVDCVIVYEISRLARRPDVLYSIRDFLIDNHVQLVCIKPYMRLLDSDGTMSQTASLLFSLFGALAEGEMIIKKERMLRGKLAKRDRGKFIGGNILFGYRYDEDEKIVIDEAEAKTVVKIFNRYIGRESIRSIARDLVDKGELRYDDYSTACVMLRRMIRRSEYAGIKQDTYDYPQIIPTETYYKAREIASSKNRYTIRTLKSIFWCQGIIYWMPKSMMMSPSKTCVQYKAWDENTNSGTMINLNYIDSLALHVVKKHRESMSDARLLEMKASMILENGELLKKINNALMKQQDVIKTIERINERIVKNKMDEKQGDMMIEEQNKIRISLRDQIISWNNNIIANDKQLNRIASGEPRDILDELDDEKIYNIIHEEIDRIEIFKNNKYHSTDKKIVMKMKDNTLYIYKLTKRGNFFLTKQIDDDKEVSIDVKIIPRYLRKGCNKICTDNKSISK